MKATFEGTISILVQAYLKDTLQHGDCAACAVGNIIAHNMGYEIVDHPFGIFGDKSWRKNVFSAPIHIHWQRVVCTRDGRQRIKPYNYDSLARPQIEASGYSIRDLAKIEYAFETAPGSEEDEDAWMFNGLMAVVDVLSDIHRVDLEVKEAARAMFVK